MPFVVLNSGGADSEAASLQGAVYTLVPDTTTPDPDDLRADPIPALDAKGAAYSAQFELGTLHLDANATHYVDRSGPQDSDRFVRVDFALMRGLYDDGKATQSFT